MRILVASHKHACIVRSPDSANNDLSQLLFRMVSDETAAGGQQQQADSEIVKVDGCLMVDEPCDSPVE